MQSHYHKYVNTPKFRFSMVTIAFLAKYILLLLLTFDNLDLSIA